MKRIAVVGGGIFGSTAAIFAARAGHEVHLFEKSEGLLQAASGINQYRLHRGYHYPRSPETAQSSILAETSFRQEYGEAVIDEGDHFYAIAREGSRVTAEQYLQFCKDQGLSYEVIAERERINPDKVDLVLRGKEAWVDPNRLRKLVEQKLKASGIHVHLNTEAEAKLKQEFDAVVIAAYASTNAVTEIFTHTKTEHQYEVCEKPIVELPGNFGMTGIVVMDGPFMCVDPLGRTGQYVLGNVEHAIHATNVGRGPLVPSTIAPLLNKGIIKNPPVTNFSMFIEQGAQYIPALAQARHVGSMFTVRTVLPKLDATDARPTIVSFIDDSVVKIFSGKIGNSVLAAQEAVALIGASKHVLAGERIGSEA